MTIPGPNRSADAMRRPGSDPRAFIVALATALVFVMAPARALELPQGDVLLIIDGEIEHTNVGDEAHFDRAMLESLDRHAFVTDTAWSDVPERFEGARLDALLTAVGARSEAFVATGIDDYSIEFDGVDLERYPVIVAFLRDGRPMSVRELGPLRIMFPFSDYPQMRTHTNEALTVWQLVRMTVQ